MHVAKCSYKCARASALAALVQVSSCDFALVQVCSCELCSYKCACPSLLVLVQARLCKCVFASVCSCMSSRANALVQVCSCEFACASVPVRVYSCNFVHVRWRGLVDDFSRTVFSGESLGPWAFFHPSKEANICESRCHNSPIILVESSSKGIGLSCGCMWARLYMAP